jgi:hypothetical protein
MGEVKMTQENHDVLNFIGAMPTSEQDFVAAWLRQNVGGHEWTWAQVEAALAAWEV